MARLLWLIRLRWLALAGVSAGAAVAAGGLVPGVDGVVVSVAVLLGVASNLFFTWRARRLGKTDDQHVGQALLDTGALTIVLWAAGGAACPFVGFYVFPVLLAALLGGRRAMRITGAASALGLAFQVAVAFVPALQVGRWDPAPPFDLLLAVGAVGATVGMAAYFAARLTAELRHQVKARRQADALLALAFEGLDAGLEVVAEGRVTWQNDKAERLFGLRSDTPWICPGRRDAPCEDGGPGCLPLERPCRFAVSHPDEERIYEVMALPMPTRGRFLTLYLDRTTDILHQRQLMITERLASLGRTVQGVAHELNTPLATIQTLGRDILDALEQGAAPPALRADVAESADVIVAEVQRCRRITHALLGRVERLDPNTRPGEAALSAALDRALAVVFTHERDRVALALDAAAAARFPLDPIVQIGVNLLQNARDAAPDGRVQVSVALEGERVRLRIVDEGPGLSPEARRHLFEPFFTTKPPGQGTGLGLYTSMALARGLGGELTVANHPAGGAVATLSLPAPTTLSAPSTAAGASAGTP